MPQFQVLEKLADGAAAELFLAQMQDTREQVVVEVLRPELLQDRTMVDRFLAEAVMRRTLVHPHVARRVKSGRTANGRPYLLSEPVTGENLRRVLSTHGPLSPADAVKLLLPLCDAVGYLHARRLTHGNLSPDNVFLHGGLQAFDPKLLDSGLMLLRTGKPLPGGAAAKPLVRSEYLAPERVRGTRATPASDIYGLGVLLYEVLTGRPPFSSADVHQTRSMHVHAPLPSLPSPLQAFNPVLLLCLAKEPEQRFESAAALREALARVPLPEPRAQAASLSLGGGKLEAGVVLGSYALGRPLGKGAMGQVFEARHTRLGRSVALKVLNAEYAEKRTFVDRFFQEARAANQVRHENIVEVYDFIEEPDSPTGPRYALVMELLQGASLAQVLREGHVSVRRAVHITRQVAEALEAAHRVGVIHRDIKPDNIFITARSGKSDHVKVLDFGIAKLAAAEAGAGLTMTGQVLGTPAYMAPEQLSSKPLDGRIDIYALGTVLYQMLAGKLPFRSPNLGEQLKWLVSTPPPPLGTRAASGETLAPMLAKLVLRCLEKDPGARPQTMGELSALLLPFEAEGAVARAPGADAPMPVVHGYLGLEEPAAGPALPVELEEEEEPLELATPARTADLLVRTPTPMTLRSPGASTLRTSPGLTVRTSPGLPVRTPTGQARVVPAAPRPLRARMGRWLPVAGALGLLAAGAGVVRLVQARSAAAGEGASASIQLQVQSTPTGARVTRLDTGAELGTTPLTLQLAREERSVVLRLEKPGHRPAEREVQLVTDRWLFVDLLPVPSGEEAGDGERRTRRVR